ncbi:hypothetical protein N7466_010872 [Penicillium verhagenii]|uniref:uncharacterized protein n=1 Tax=Penicillium verhagenii TaxID=1562060 RepID=UPI0025453327|nr:uncharacterized protein N7466_010872 [Penicillium verhagenii]KAJ5917318.1 hypothetical protein N7466_010872 [Penicillium verhagenii]
MTDLASIRWGIITTGLISSWFVEDLLLTQTDAKVNHIVHAIGASTLEKGQKFAAQYCPIQNPTIYDSYEKVYSDPEVDVVYIGTPHGLHYEECMKAIAAGKNILCEKAFTMNAKQAREIFEAAEKKNVYIAEAMWLRHRPIYLKLRELIHENKIIGDVTRVFSDFASEIDIPSLPPTSRYRDLALGAGSLLDIGVYSLTWLAMALEKNGNNVEMPKILASQTHEEGIEVATSAILQYPRGALGIASCTTKTKGSPGKIFAVIHGTKGHIEVSGNAPSFPESFTVWERQADPGTAEKVLFDKEQYKNKTYTFPKVGRGFIWEADNTALDVLEGRKQSHFVPWATTIRLLDIMDEIRRQGGTVYPGE